MHSTFSDGTLTPGQLLELARQAELAAFSITDHDTLDGYLEAVELVRDDDPELVAGLELSVSADGSDLHMLAYLFEPDDDALREALERFRRERNLRGRRMVEKLNLQGLELSMEAVLEAADGSAIGRPHMADAMVSEGMVGSFEEAFHKYIGNHCPAYLPKSKVDPKAAIDLVHGAGGITVMAHPFVNDMHRRLPELADLGLDGVEVYHYAHSSQQIKEAGRLAKQHGLLMSGGSDFHGRQEHEGEIGAYPVPVDYLHKMRHRAEEIRGSN